MKNIAYIFFAYLVLGVSCTGDFAKLNENPNAPQQVDPQFLLTNVISEAANRSSYEQGFRLANYLSQFAASVEFERIDRYEMGSNSGYWTVIYRMLSDLRSVKELSGNNEAYKAVASIMESYLYSQLTDMWGDVPYLEAVKALDDQFTPKYDSQKEIYTNPETGILAVLKKSAATLETTNDAIRGDVMFNNDLSKWVRFANSLRFRYLLRISNKISDFSEMKALANSGKLINSNSQNAEVKYLSAAPNQWPMSQASLGLYQEHRMTKTVEATLKSWNDPRMKVLYKPTQQSITEGAPAYVGLENGQDRETISAKGINLNNVSLFGAMFRDVPDGVSAQFISYAEVQFALAEAAKRGFIEGNAEQFYNNGVAASFEYYKVALPSDYFENPAVALDGSNDLTKILTQKWLALINVGHEAWFEIRRTGIPAIKAGPDNLNNDMLPVRYLYPESEQATNSANYKSSLAIQGPDDINTKVWWEKN
ncbi:Starch-binding associating with outer membrane [Spirosomataceae bacterium TFI 002]|nr:Starch-binding associating with outer membrane [Spirosomataceae bacterium TFI 002]